MSSEGHKYVKNIIKDFSFCLGTFIIPSLYNVLQMIRKSFYLFILINLFNLFYFWLHWVFVAALGLFSS